MTSLIQIAKDWQTLIAAMIALFAAGWNVWTLRVQINDERKRHRDAFDRKSMSVRAQMPDALSDLAQFAAECALFIDGQSTQAPRPRPAAIDVLKAAIEYVDNHSAEEIFALVSHYQVHNARFFGLDETTRYPADRLFDVAVLQCRVNRLFKFARNEESVVTKVPISRKDMLLALTNAVGFVALEEDREPYKGAIEIINRRYN